MNRQNVAHQSWRRGWLSIALSIGIVLSTTAASDGDLVLGIGNATIAPGAKGSLLVTLESDAGTFEISAWDTELVVDSNANLIQFINVTPATKGEINEVLNDFMATVNPSKLQAGAFAPAGATKTTAKLNPEAGQVTLYRVDYCIVEGAGAGKVIAVNFSANGFTNFLDPDIRPIPLVRSGATITVSSVPEPSAPLLFAVPLALFGISAAVRYRSRLRGPALLSARDLG